jgi:hypothetical protein
MLRMFYNCFSSVFHVFLQVFHMHISSVSSAFKCMLQMLHLDVLKLDRVASPSSLSAASSRCLLLLPALGGHLLPLPSLLDVVTFRAAQAPRGREQRLQARASGRRVRPDD